MADHTPHQKKIIDRYYEHRDGIMLQKLAELVTELYLAETEKKRERLWQRVDAAMKNLKVSDAAARRILEKRDAALLASHLKDWQGQSDKR